MEKIINKKIAVLGLGVEGKDLLKFLLGKSKEITLFDQKPKDELDLSDIDSANINFVCGPDYLDHDLSQYDIIFRSPGIYRFKEKLIEAEEKGVEISSNIKLFLEICPAKIIGVTGTKGKGTTSTLIYEIVKNSGKDVHLAGNIGKPTLELLPKLTQESFVILELSSFQLIDLNKSPYISVVLNITSDHMDWHKNRQEYLDAKANIVSHQTKNDFAVINEDYDDPKSFAKLTKAKVILFSKNTLPNQFKQKLLLRGEHNLENIAAAVSVAKILDIAEEKIIEVVSTFKGLEHRLELVSSIDGVSFYNDSFSTGPQPAIAAVNSFTEGLTIILGGYDKGLDYDELALTLAKRGPITNVLLIGDLTDKINTALLKHGFKQNIFLLNKSSMKDIVIKAKEVTPTGGVVVLSPAGASFDMFKDYKDRGNQFKNEVLSLNNA